MLSIFGFTTYKSFLKSYIDQNQRPGLISEIAKLAGCNRTYLSQCLSGKVHLTPDQAISLAYELGFIEAEQNYFLYLVLFNRASQVSTKQILKKKMESIVTEQSALTKKIKNSKDATEISSELKSKYYSNWLFGAIHVMTSIPSFQTLHAITQKLNISNKRCEEILSFLIEIKLIVKKGERFEHAGGNIYVPAGSTLNTVNHMNWRNRALQGANDSNEVHYTTAFSLSVDDLPLLKDQLFEFVKQQRQKIHMSGTEIPVVFCCDLFEI